MKQQIHMLREYNLDLPFNIYDRTIVKTFEISYYDEPSVNVVFTNKEQFDKYKEFCDDIIDESEFECIVELESSDSYSYTLVNDYEFLEK